MFLLVTLAAASKTFWGVSGESSCILVHFGFRYCQRRTMGEKKQVKICRYRRAMLNFAARFANWIIQLLNTWDKYKCGELYPILHSDRLSQRCILESENVDCRERLFQILNSYSEEKKNTSRCNSLYMKSSEYVTATDFPNKDEWHENYIGVRPKHLDCPPVNVSSHVGKYYMMASVILGWFNYTDVHSRVDFFFFSQKDVG